MDKPSKRAVDPEMAEFEAALLRSVDQAMRGEGRVTTPDQIVVRRSGRPVGSVKAAPKAQGANDHAKHIFTKLISAMRIKNWTYMMPCSIMACLLYSLSRK